jgi:pilus assembly protein CpaE
VRRALIVHPEADVRASLDRMLRAVSPVPIVVEWSASLADGVRRARTLQPHVVLLDICGERTLALQAISEVRAPGRLVAALYNPLILRGDLQVVREFTRAGIGDYLPLPASEGDVRAALAAADLRGGEAPSEGQVIAFFSQQGGVGTTTLAANTAVLMAGSDEVNAPVVLCDAAVQFGSAAAMLGLTPLRDMSDFIDDPKGGASLSACLTEEPGSGLEVLAAPRDPLSGNRITAEDLTRVLIELRRRFAWVIVDTPPVLDLLTLSVLDSADRIFVVTEATTPTVLGTARLLRLLEGERIGRDRLRVVLNRFNAFEGNLSEQTVVDRLGREVDHVVPYDRGFVVSATRGRPYVAGRPSTGVAAALSGLGEDAAGLRHEPAEARR